MIKVIIIDDNADVRLLIEKLLADHPQIKIIGQARNCSEAIALISKKEPDVILLDIEMPDGSGFDVLKHFPNPLFKTIVISAYNQYAINALKLSAVDYLLKPITREELIESIEQTVKNIEDQEAQYGLLKKYLKQSPNIDRLVIPSDTHKKTIMFSEILFLKSDGGYSLFYTIDGHHIITSRSIKYYDEILPSNFFFRTHKSFIVNFEHILSIPTGRSGVIEIANDQEAQLSVRRASKFRKWYKEKTLGRDN